MSKATTISNAVAIATIVDVLRLRAETQRDEIAYRFLADGEEERGTLTYGELYSRARRVAAELQKQSGVGQRALLLDSSEADYIVTFFGCLCAGVIAVPIYAPRLNKKGNARVESVVADAQPSVVLTAGAVSPGVRDVITASAGKHVKWIDTKALPVDGDELWTPPAVRGTDIAFLQYTSGSTAAPKGVMVSHANILHNEGMIQNAFDTKPGSVIVGWLPLFHDMGLIGNVLQPLYAGVPCILMSPVAFLQRPLRWLQAISRYQATTSGGPNFAYELCMRKIRPEDRSGLDLSSWRVAFNGAEPVRLETVNRFAAQFADCSFRREAFVPCYGLAEATLFVSGGLDPNGVTTVNHGANGNSNNGGSGKGAKISQKQGKLLVASGRPSVEQAVRIVSPDSLRPCSAGDVGEIWTSGPSVAQGYWRKAKETEETFKARIPEIDEGPFLRTGDLGFLQDGHLFITGRLKDLLIIRGQNYYPQDIELTVEQSHPILQPGSGAAFSVEIEGEERLVVVQEVAVRKGPESIVQSDLDELDALIKLISRNIVAGHELQAFALVLIRKGTIPKTSSGKIQRHACRDAFLNRELYVLREWQERKQLEPVLPKPSNPELDGHGPYGLASWVVQEISHTQGIDQERVDLNQPFAAYGLDSLAAIEFAHKLQAEFQVEVDVAEFFGDSTITEVIRRATKNTQSPVRKVEKEQPATYPLSYGQRALWFMHRMAPESAAYNISRTFRIKAAVDVEALRDAFQALVDGHPALRTTIVETAGEPLQHVAEKARVSFEYHDATNWDNAELTLELLEQTRKPFRLAEGPLFRVHLYRLAEKDYLMHVTVHHIVSDLWSLMLLFEQLGKLYEQRSAGHNLTVPTCERSYADFVAWQREHLAGPEGERLWSYWKDELSGELAPLDLPTDHPRPPVQTFRGSSRSFFIDQILCDRLKQISTEAQTTLFVTLFAAFQVLLHRLSGQNDIVVGFPTTGRPRAELAHVTGYFVNVLPLRAKFDHTQSFSELLFQVRKRVLGALSHDLYPFALMIEKLGIARDSSVAPVFQTMFVFQKTYGNSEEFVRLAVGESGVQLRLGGLQMESVAIERQTTQFDLTLTAGEGPDGLVGSLEYSSELFEADTIARWAESFSVLLEGIVSNPKISVSQLPILSAREYGTLVYEWNATEQEYPREKCVHELFEEQVARTPQAVAVVFEEEELSYGELNARANRLAHYLRGLGVKPDERVAICVERGFEMIVGLLAVLKAGGGYVPLDPAYPEERLQYMLEDSAPVVLLTQRHLEDRFSGIGEGVPVLDLNASAAWQSFPESNPDAEAGGLMSSHLAYVIYTSGSTGRPKGVMNEHRGIVNLLTWTQHAFGLVRDEAVLQKTSFSFDASVRELFWPLIVGARIVMERSEGDKDPDYLVKTIRRNNITTVKFVPSMLQVFLEQTKRTSFSTLTRVLCGGEALDPTLVRRFYEQMPHASLHNLYGPTEAAVNATAWSCPRGISGADIPIGRPIANTRVYILDSNREPVPVGVVGEMYVGGVGVARGYLKRPELTAERFVPDPFVKEPGARMYRTGDLARWLADGNIGFLGRNDNQVKIRGFRIELGEIETRLAEYPEVREAVVLAREDTLGEKRLVAYYTASGIGEAEAGSVGAERLRAHLSAVLPDYMVPAAYVRMERLPLTPNGKLDRKALPMPEQEAYAVRGYEAPVGEIETKLAAVWAEVLHLEKVGRHDNFFDLGGHSLLATQVISRIREGFHVELPLHSLFQNPTVAGLALQVDGAARTVAPPLLPLPREQSPRLSFAQERLWFLSRYEAEASWYNVPVALRLRGPLDREALHASLQEIVARHEVLRTSFPETDGTARQNIASAADLSMPVIEMVESEMPKFLWQQARLPFDLATGPLIRTCLLQLGNQDHVLLVVLHHIVCDGWSLGVMLREFNVLYDSFSRGTASPLPPLPIQYADYSEWQREWLQGEVLERQLDYWRKQLAGHEILNLPADRPHSAKPTLAGAMETSRLPKPLLSKLKLLSDQQGVTLFMTLLAGFEILLYRYTGQTDISVGSAIANRSRQELEPLIGFFVNILVLRTQFTEDSSVAELLQRVRDVSLQAYAHQDIPFERLVEALDPVRELGRTPFFQVLFALQNAPLPTVSWDGLEATASIVETGTAKFDLTLSAREEDGELELSLEYRTELFDAERMKRLLQHYRTLLEGMAVSVETRLSELEILMVPAALRQDTMPLTTNGKADRKALIELESKKAMEEVGSLTLTPTEELIAGVWSSLLEKSEIRRDDNFFALGGHSLTSIQMLARVEKVFNREINLHAIFEFPVLKDFSAYVDRLTGPAQPATLRPIVPTSRDGRLPLSFAQQRLWFLGQMEGASAAYHIPFGLHLKGDLNRTALGRALDRIVVRHEVLRTTFALYEGEPVQEIGSEEESSFRLIEHDLRGHNDVEAELAALRELEARASFDLEAGPLIRGRLIRLAEDEHVLLVTMHHIVSDGWSMGVLVRELNALYGAFLGGEANPLPELEIQYADYAVWQREWIEGEILQQQAAYWKTTLAGAPALLELPTDHPRPMQQDFAGGFVELALDEQLTAGLKDLSRRNGTTLYMTLLAGWGIVLARLSGQQDVVIGSPVANRGRAEIENLIGFFVNTLALRLDLSGSPRVSELLLQSKAQSLAAQRHQDIPFEQVVELAQPVRSLAHSPLFQVMFAWQNAAEARLELPGLEVQPLPSPSHRVAKFDLTLALQESGERIVGELGYATALYERSTVDRYREYFLRLVEAMVADDAQVVDHLRLLTGTERHQVLYEWNATEREYPREKCVHELFEEQVARTPQAVAVVFEEEELSYGELNARANRLAHYLRGLGVKPDERVAICVERGFEMIVGLLAVLKAGGGYVPLDPAYPEERLQYMLEDSAPVVLLTQRHLEDRFSGIGEGVPVLDLNASAAWQSFPESNPDAEAGGLMSSHLAYVIYTSGSTGRPKGVMVEHRGLCNISLTQSRELKVEPGSRILQFASFSFDACAWETLMALCHGAALYLLPQKCVVAGDELIETAARDGITHATLPPTVLAGVSEGANVDSLRVLMVGGEALPGWLAERWGRERRLINAYGPTETTIVATMHRCAAEESGNPPIGRPITNTRVYILDSNREPVPVGMVGEMCIGGAGVARGYLKRPELTAERFVPDPFVKEPGARMYRTGDLARWLADGNIGFLGRNDNQVKIRGFRIELGEIEARLAEHAKVREAVVLAREDTLGEKRLVAYYTAAGVGEGEAGSVGAEQLRAHLLAVVPDYMVPAAYVRMEKLPLMPNGKLDRKALPMPEQDAYAVRGYEAPVGEIETKLAEVWAEVLKLEKVGRHDNFFELGGHSLLATRVVSRIREGFHVELPLHSLFQNPTVAGLALQVDGAARTAAPPLRALPREQSPRLSFAQERLWFLSRYEAEASWYNVPVALRLRGPLNREALHAGLQEIVARHEVLRTSFPETDGTARQNIASAADLSMLVVEMVESEMLKFLRQQARLPFDLATGPLIRTCLLQLGNQDHVLLIVLHHIVCDGWSLGVMLREFNALYDSFSRGAASPLPPLPVQYADYSEWQREWLQGEVLERQLDYWRKQLAGHETLNLPADRPHSARLMAAGAMERSRLPGPLLSKLKLLSDQQGVTLFMTLLAGFEILLYRYTGQTDISVGSAIANRSRQELESLIGFFVNTLVLRTQFTEDSSVAELLQRVRDVSLQAYAHQDIPFERLVEALDPVRELSRTPFFQVLFALQNAPLPTVSWQGLEATAINLETGTAKFDLTLSAREEDGELELSLEYRTELFNAERMKRLLQHYRTLLEGMVVSVDARIGELELLSEPERRQLLVEWNRTEAPDPSDKCVHELFEEQAAKTPQAVAVIDEDGQIGYEELNRRANRLAHYLARMGVGPEVRVGICMERGLEMMVGALGVLKAGGACVPLDPADPGVRRSYMVKDAGAKIVLMNERLAQQMAGCAEHVVDLEEAREEIEKQSGDNLNVNLDAETLAWVIYTSSSTGRTKGMAIPHRSAVSVMQPKLIDAIDQNPSVERLLNLYAPTEDTTYSTYAEVQDDGTGLMTIRRSQSNTRAYVLDGHMKLVPVGVKGELYLSGAGQARGYLNRPELTAEKFVPDPFSKTRGERLYRTGDLVRYRENGNLEFMGRLDSQVKIQGHRIEPGEIEAAVLDYPGVTQAAVITRENKPGNVRLAGYVAGSERLDVDRLRNHLQQRVPEYMVPVALLQLDTMPLTTNGKVDRKALIELESKKAMEEVGSLTLTSTEELIAGVWSSLLEKSDIRRGDNFFALGGHSLTSIQMLARVEKVFNREINLHAIFEFPVLKDFSAYVDQLTGPAPLAMLRPIVPTSRDGRLPLSFAQQRLWFLGQMEGASAAYHIPFGLHLKGDLNRTALGRALDRIVVRHEVLRTTFALYEGEPVQEIGAEEESSFRLIEHDLRGHNDVEAELAALRELEARASFDLEAGPLIRGRLIRLAEDEHVLLVTMHHIVSDGWSMGVLVRELNALYRAFLGGGADPLPELEIQYADYAVWQREWIEGEILQQQAAYWKTTLAGAPALLELPTDHPRPMQRDFAGGFVELALDEQLTAGLKDLSRRNGTTLYMTLLAGWGILLARLSGQQDVVIGSPVANRGRAEIENLIGFFVNTLALRLDLSGSPRVSELLLQSKAQSLAAQRHQDIPFEQVVELAQPVRSLAYSPLFQVMFAWQNATESLLELPGLKLQPFVPSSHKVAKFDMTLSLRATGDTIGGGIEYASALFESATIHRYIGYFLALLKAMVADDAQTIDRLPMVSEGEREQVLYGWNETKAEFPAGKCVHELFEEQVAGTPQAVAVIYEEERLNYGELNERANRLAWRLRELGVGPETIVGLMVERSIGMVVALLGVLKAGAAYVPLDPGSTRERLKYMVEDSGARLVLSSVSLSSIISAATDVEVLAMEAQEWLLYSGEKPRVSVEPSQLAYVIYTSGSTGRPKGVGVEHRQLVNYVQAIGRKLQIEPGARLGLVSTFAADLGYTMIFPALCHGGCLDVVDANRVLDAGKLEEHFSRHPIDYLKIVPSHMRALLNSNTGSGFLPKRWLVLGGEASSWDLIQQVKGRGAGCRVLNHYGPTETTVGVLTCDTTSSNSTQEGGGLRAGGMVPIGRPLSNGKVYVLDSELNPVGVGVSGEIYIAGAGVARGYLKREDLTAEKFMANPYSTEPGGRMYRTGDLGRYLENGNVEFLGRRDHQVKIRGFRIELGEIEARLAEHPALREAVVLAHEDAPGEKRLVAYVVPERESEESNNGSGREGLQMSELREHLLDKLPEYMVPTAYVQLKKIPLTPNGKIDRKSLPEPDKDIREQEYVGPRNAAEETLCRLWQEVLRRERVGIHDNFFNIGGHSLLAVQVISRIKQAFTIEMPLSVLFAAPTVARMAEHIGAVNEPGRSQSSPVLVNIQPHGSRPPFFCVHAVGGQVIGYAELSHELGLEQPFYGLQSPPANYFPESGVSIEQLATLYNQEIRSVQPRGPYLLSGWSMGGLVAWEMAQQLKKEGEIISLLALIDTAPPPKYREAEDRADEISMLARFAMDMSRLVGRDPGPLVEQFLQADEQDQWKMAQETLTSYGVLAPKTAHAEMTALLNVFTRNALAMNNYSLQTSKQAVIYFRASETPERFSRAWTKWSGGGIQFHSVPGDHFTMLRRPGVRIIAETLQRYISMNSNNEVRVVSPEMSPRELIGLESQHTP